MSYYSCIISNKLFNLKKNLKPCDLIKDKQKLCLKFLLSSLAVFCRYSTQFHICIPRRIITRDFSEFQSKDFNISKLYINKLGIGRL